MFTTNMFLIFFIFEKKTNYLKSITDIDKNLFVIMLCKCVIYSNEYHTDIWIFKINI